MNHPGPRRASWRPVPVPPALFQEGRPRSTGRVRALLLAALLAVLAAAPLRAQGLIRDAEIERSLKRIAAPLFRAAGVAPVDVLVVNDRSMNAFVIDGRAIFVNVGLLTRLKDVEMLQAVLAHELAHVTAGHLLRRGLGNQSTATAIGVGILLGMAVGAAGRPDLAGGIAMGTAGTALNKVMAHSRAQETTADRIGARYLARAGIDPMAAVRVLELFRGQEALAITRQEAYARTHPLSGERIRALKAQAAVLADRARPPAAALVYWHRRMLAKFRGFTGNPSYVLRHLPRSDRSEFASLTRAIAYHRQGRLQKALAALDPLIRARPDDAYYHELKGQILLENRRTAAAVGEYRRAVALAPREPLILAGLGRALLALGRPESDREALSVLRKARAMDGRDARLLRDLAVAWSKAGNDGMAALVTAERYALTGRLADARTAAERAARILPRGSAGWLRAQDVLAATRKFAKKRK